MSLHNASGFTAVEVLKAQALATTATGAAVDVSAYEGDLVFIQSCGTVTSGTCATVLQHSTATGSGWAAITGGTFTEVTTSNDPLTEKIVIPANSVNKYVRSVTTVATGAMPASIVVLGASKYT